MAPENVTKKNPLSSDHFNLERYSGRGQGTLVPSGGLIAKLGVGNVSRTFQILEICMKIKDFPGFSRMCGNPDCAKLRLVLKNPDN